MSELEQRREVRSQLQNVRETRTCPADFEFREVANGVGGANVIFTGYASVTCRDANDTSAAYEMEDALGPWTESVIRGAFATTLKNRADVAFLVNHEGITLARTKPGTLRLAEDETGLHVEARLDPANPLVQQVRSGVERGDLDEMSFAFRVTRQEWNEDYTQRWITEVNMAQGDVSVVNYGANPHTGGLVAIRSAEQAGIERLASTFANLYEQRTGKLFEDYMMSRLERVLSFLPDDDGEEPIDAFLADVMGVELRSDADPEPVADAGPSAFDVARAKQMAWERERKYRRKSA